MREIYKDEITKLIDGKSLDEVIENLTKLRNQNFGCEIIKLKHSINMQPIVCLYDIVNDLPNNVDLNRNPTHGVLSTNINTFKIENEKFKNT